MGGDICGLVIICYIKIMKEALLEIIQIIVAGVFFIIVWIVIKESWNNSKWR